MINLMEHMLPAPPDGGFRMDGFWIWCGSVIRGEDGKYHMFASRWPKSYTMHPGWIFKSEIVRAVSEKPEGPYTYVETVLPQRGSQYWDGRATHNPFISKYKDTYILYYVGTTFPFSHISPDSTNIEDEKYIVAQSNKRIGKATSKSIFGPWKRSEKPVLDVRADHFDSFLVSNPAPYINKDGSVNLVYKARAYEKDGSMGRMVLAAAYADSYDELFSIRTDKPLFDFQNDTSEHGAIEDPFIWKQDTVFYMIAKDMTGLICGERYAGILAVSNDVLDWSLQKGVKSYSRKIIWSDGTVKEMGSFERPFILFERGAPSCLFAAVSDGHDGFANALNTWNMAIPM